MDAVAMDVLERNLIVLVLSADTFLERVSNEPDFVGNIKNVTVPAGREAILSCSVSNLGKFKWIQEMLSGKKNGCICYTFVKEHLESRENGWHMENERKREVVEHRGKIIHTWNCSKRVGFLRAEDQTILTLDTKVVTHSGRVTVTHDGVQWNLHIRPVKPQDEGCYMCQLNTAVMKKQVGCLSVNVSPTIIDEETSTDLTVREGENVTLVCKATGRPPPKVTWRREDGESIMVRRGLRDVYKVGIDNLWDFVALVAAVLPFLHSFIILRMDLGLGWCGGGYDKIVGTELQFVRVDRRQMGTFLCIASNEVSPVAPLVKVQNQLLGAPYGSNLTLVCEIQAMPKPFVYWKIVNRGPMLLADLGLKNSSKYTIEEKRLSYKVSTSLTIRNFGSKDVGIYQCISTNSIGKSEGNIRLHEIKLNRGTSAATEHHPVTLPGYATPPISTEGRIHHTNNRDLWTSYDVAPNPVMTPHDTKSEVNRNDISAISSSVATTTSWRTHLPPSSHTIIPLFLVLAAALPNLVQR
ncbi:Lachesin [Folsomia candida]|uniref:Lachesin n=1 Tax=Folsomia candida TaxID=158441 RepID=A0A226F5C3_FOLCA|nr:Lachesin [Folsomia candida]